MLLHLHLQAHKMSSQALSPLLLLLTLTFFFTNPLRIHSHADPNPVDPTHLQPQSSATIPAFPEQSSADADHCSLKLPDQLFHSINAVCGATSHTSSSSIHFSRCCPVLATWLYAASSSTALLRAARIAKSTPANFSNSLPLLPDDSETCVADLDRAMAARGLRLARPNQTCDLIYCYCGIRLRPLRCPEAFRVDEGGAITGDRNVKKLESACLSNDGLPGCSKCLYSLNQLDVDKKSGNSSVRSKKMHHSDCQIMGVTWLLAKNRTAYIHTVSAVLRSIMTNKDGETDPKSCTLGSDGMPLAVDSTQISNAAAESYLRSWFWGLISLALLGSLYSLPF